MVLFGSPKGRWELNGTSCLIKYVQSALFHVFISCLIMMNNQRLCHLNDVKRPMMGQLLLFHSVFFHYAKHPTLLIPPEVAGHRSSFPPSSANGPQGFLLSVASSSRDSYISYIYIYISEHRKWFNCRKTQICFSAVSFFFVIIFASSFSVTHKNLGSFHNVCFLFNPFFVLN